MTALLIGISLASSAAIIAAVKADPSRLVRPSTGVLALVNLRIQWPSALNQDLVHFWLTDVVGFNVLIHLFMGLGIYALLATNTPALAKYQRRVWRAAQQPARLQLYRARSLLPWLVALSLLIAVYYFATVPLRSTGLYAVFSDPTGLAEARDNSLKLLPSAALRYAVSWQLNTFAPMLLAFAVLYWFARRRAAASVIFIWSAAMLGITGSRQGFAFVPLTIAVVVAVLHWPKFRAHIVALTVVAVLTATAILTMTAYVTLAREGRALTPTSLTLYTREVALGRVFTTPLRVGVWYADYKEEIGPLGVSSIRPLAGYYSRDFILLSRVIGQAYAAPGSDTIISNTNFLFAYYAAFGLAAAVLSVAVLLLFDAVLIPVSKVPELALPFIAALIVKATLQSEGVFTTALLTGGYVLLPLIAVFAMAVRKRRPAPIVESRQNLVEATLEGRAVEP